MRVFHFILGKAAKDRANGVNQVVAGLAKYSVRAGHQVRIIGKARTTEEEGQVIARDGFEVIAYTRWGRSLREAVRQAIEWADAVHLHGAYAPYNIWLGRLCEAHGKPYVVTLHGGLSPVRKAARGWLRKTVYHMLFQDRHLAQAALIHALTEEEASDVFAFARPKRVAVIPNGVDLEDFPPSPPKHADDGPIRIGYIGRLSGEKNLPALCEAFAALNQSGEMQLLLAGPATTEGEAIARAWSGAGIVLAGERYGASKISFLQGLDIFVHPSKTDVFSIAAMEALASGVPTVITRTSDASHFAEAKAFVMCEPTAFGLERGLRKMLVQRDDWANMAKRGRELVEQRLNWNSCVADLTRAYESIVGPQT